MYIYRTPYTHTKPSRTNTFICTVEFASVVLFRKQANNTRNRRVELCVAAVTRKVVCYIFNGVIFIIGARLVFLRRSM